MGGSGVVRVRVLRPEVKRFQMPSSDPSLGAGAALLRVFRARGLAAAVDADALVRAPDSLEAALPVDRARGLASALAAGSAAVFAADRVEGLRVRGFRVTAGPALSSASDGCEVRSGLSVPSVAEAAAG